MTARDDYPVLAEFAAVTKTTSTLPAACRNALDELDTLRIIAHYAAAWRDAAPDAAQSIECRDLIAVIDNVLRTPDR